MISVSFVSADTAANQVVIATFPAGQVPASTVTGPPCNGQAGPCTTVNAGQTFTVQDVEGISGVSTFTFTTVALANPVTVANNQWVSVQITKTSGGAASPHGLIAICNSGCSSVANTFDSCINFGTVSPVVGTGYSEASLSSCGPGLNLLAGATFAQSGSTGTGFVTTTTCYGNCGTPPITLANTNSTHGFNFNQSLTLFYEFQSNANGFVLNVTTNVAKTYSNGQVVALGVYTIASCPVGTTPFTTACPGLLQFSKNVQNPLKGQQSLTLTGGSVPVSNGQWIGISVSGLFSPLDLNDTNTNVNIFQTNGMNPAVITQSSQLTSCACKTGLWAWIVGNTVTSAPPSTPALGLCGAMDCILSALANGFCSNATAACQTSGSIFWSIIITILFMVVMGVTVGTRVKLPFGELFILLFVGLVMTFAGLGLTLIWVPIFFFMIVAVLFARHSGKYF